MHRNENTPNDVQKSIRNDELRKIIFNVIGKKYNQTTIYDADREIPTIRSTDNWEKNLISNFFRSDPFSCSLSMSTCCNINL